jgi:hypothetical protein
MKNSKLLNYFAVSMLTVSTIVIFGGIRVPMAQEPAKTLTVAVAISSGQPNPTFEITEPGEMDRLRAYLSDLPEISKEEGELAGFNWREYRGIVITNPMAIEGIPRYLQILDGKVKVVSSTKEGDTRFFLDVEAMEHYYLAMARDLGLIP